MRRWGALLVVMSLALAALSMAASAVVVDLVLVYDGGGATNEGYTAFGSATGKAVVTSATLEDLAQYDCVVLPANNNFSESDLSALTSYVNGGGRLLALGEHNGFAGTITAMNGLAVALQSDLSLVAAFIDGGFNTTTNIDPSPFTTGVASIRYAATSEVAVAPGPTAHSLVRTANSATTFIGIEKIGQGVFALSGDTNVFSDNSDTGYTAQNNGTLAANICDGANFANNAPVAEDDIAETEPGVSVNINVLTNDSDPDGDPLTVTNLTQPANGSTFVDEDGTVRYTPGEGFSGDIDTFTYTANDGIADSNIATVTVGVFAGDVVIADVPAGESFVLETQEPGQLTPDNPERIALNFAPGPGGPAFLVEIPNADVDACDPGVLPLPCVGNNQAQYYISSNATMIFEWHRSLFRPGGIKAGQVDFYKFFDGVLVNPLPLCNKTQPKNLAPCEQKVHTLADGTVQGIVLAGPSINDPIKGAYN